MKTFFALLVIFQSINLAHASWERLSTHITQSTYQDIIERLTGVRYIVTKSGVGKVRDRFAPDNMNLIRQYLIESLFDVGFSSIDSELFPMSSQGKRYWEDEQERPDGQNLTVEMEGRQHDQEIILLGAHYDTTGINRPGANDNASGVAAVLTIAQAFRKAMVQTNRRLLFFFFDGEERGFAGSRRFFEKARRRGANIRLFINVDMIGHSPQALLRASYDPRPFKSIGAFIEEVNRRFDLGFRLEAWREHMSDNQSGKRNGFPTVSIFEDGRQKNDFRTITYPYYHTPEDTLDKLDLQYATEVTRLIAGITYAAAETEETWETADFSCARYLAGHFNL